MHRHGFTDQSHCQLDHPQVEIKLSTTQEEETVFWVVDLMGRPCGGGVNYCIVS